MCSFCSIYGIFFAKFLKIRQRRNKFFFVEELVLKLFTLLGNLMKSLKFTDINIVMKGFHLIIYYPPTELKLAIVV